MIRFKTIVHCTPDKVPRPSRSERVERPTSPQFAASLSTLDTYSTISQPSLQHCTHADLLVISPMYIFVSPARFWSLVSIHTPVDGSFPFKSSSNEGTILSKPERIRGSFEQSTAAPIDWCRVIHFTRHTPKRCSASYVITFDLSVRQTMVIGSLSKSIRRTKNLRFSGGFSFGDSHIWR